MNTKWRLHSQANSLVRTPSSLRDLLLRQRSINESQRANYFSPTIKDSIYDPALLPGVKSAADRIINAKNERILIHGDYDADGICATAILSSTLRHLGYDATPYLPNRHHDGYGLNLDTLKSLAPNFDLLITVDCGISSADQVAWLNEQNIDTIITDHHEPPRQLPAAHAIVHPAVGDNPYPFRQLSGSGVSYKLADYLINKVDAGKDFDSKWLLDLVTLGTVADVMPLIDENRALVHFGLQLINTSPRPGIKALLDNARGVNGGVDAESLSYYVIPTINAPGRMDHPQPALDLLLAPDYSTAIKTLTDIKAINRQRQSISRTIHRQASSLINPDDDILFAYQDQWHIGVVGPVASRLSHEHQKPTVIIGGSGDEAVGSSRSPQGINILDIIASHQEHLIRFGGHANAAGFTISKDAIETLKEKLANHKIQQATKNILDTPDAAAVLDPQIISRDIAELVSSFGPFGAGNQKPAFIVKALTIANWHPVGRGDKHAKITFWNNDQPLEAIAFNLSSKMNDLAITDDSIVDTLCQIEENSFRGVRRLQLRIIDIVPA